MMPNVQRSLRVVPVAAFAAVVSAAAPVPLLAQTAADLKRMSLEELLDVDVATVSRIPEPAGDVPAAIYVITAEDIRRAGATTIPEVLRLAPGVQVSRISSTLYAVGIRGFADRLSRSMLVLIDGRAVYSPLFAGTYWEVQDTLLGDIDRIEVIRGPGGTLWGANAVNGIINIVTKHASATAGSLAGVNVGTDGSQIVAGRIGATAGENGHVRLYGKLTVREPEYHRDGNNFDDLTMGQVGFRGDWTIRQGDALTLQGDVYGARLGQRVSIAKLDAPFVDVIERDAPISGGNALVRWSGRAGASGRSQLQAYYDRTVRDELPIAEHRDTVDVDFQLSRPAGRRHQLVWGAGYRLSSGRIRATGLSSMTPPSRSDHLFTAFAQNDISIVDRRLAVILGAKVEHNGYSGAEIQPSVRALWTLNTTHNVFAAVTRAVRTPSRVETDYGTTSLVDPAVPSFVRLLPNPDFEPESLVAYEGGYRVQPADRVYATVSAFYNEHARLLSTELLPSIIEEEAGETRTILPVTFGNGVEGESFGVEATGDLRPFPWWRVIGNYSYQQIHARKVPGSNDVTQAARYPTATPRHQAMAQTSLDLPAHLSADVLLSYRSRLTFGPVPAYMTSTVRVSWQFSPFVGLTVVGSNLHAVRHVEWPIGGSNANVEIGRRVSVSLAWRR